MSIPGGTPSVPPSQWPRKWLREETFWREMVTRTLSALLAALVILLAGKAAGFFSHISWAEVGRAVGASSGVIAAILLFLVSGVPALKTAFEVDRERAARRKKEREDNS